MVPYKNCLIFKSNFQIHWEICSLKEYGKRWDDENLKKLKLICKWINLALEIGILGDLGVKTMVDKLIFWCFNEHKLKLLKLKISITTKLI